MFVCLCVVVMQSCALCLKQKEANRILDEIKIRTIAEKKYSRVFSSRIYRADSFH